MRAALPPRSSTAVSSVRADAQQTLWDSRLASSVQSGGGLAQLGEHYVRNVGVGGSTPLPSTNTQSPTRLSWGFFSSVGACCPVLLRVHAETCGPRPKHHQAGSAPGSLSFGHFSLDSSRPEMGRSPQGPPSGPSRSTTYEWMIRSIFFPALVGARNSGRINVTRNGEI